MELTLIPFEKRDDNLEIAVSVHPRGGFCFVQYTLSGDLTSVDITAEGDHLRSDNLWEECCFEMFTTPKNDTKEYSEYNFAFNGDWNVFAFSDYRIGKVELPTEELDIMIRGGKKVQRLSVMLPWESVENSLCGFSTVLKHSDGSYSYWAIGHEGDQPDFHNAKFFTAELSPAGVMFNENHGEMRTNGVMDALKSQQ